MTPARRAVSVVFALNGSLFGIWASRIPAFVERHELRPDTLGLLLLCIAGGAVLAFPVAGRISDRIGAARVTRALILPFAGTLLLLPLAPTPALLAVALALYGALYGAMDVAMNGWGAEVELDSGRSIMTTFHAAYSLGAGLGAASGVAAGALGAGPLLHFAVVALPAAGLTLMIADVPWTSRTSTEDGPTFALPHGTLILVGLVALCGGVGEGAVADWSAVFLTDVLGASAANAALGYAVFSVAMVAARLAGGRVIATLGPVRTARFSGVCAAIGALVLVTAPALWVALTGFFLLGVGYAALFPLAISRAAADPVTPPGRAIAGVATLGYGGMLLGPPLIGWIAATRSLPEGLAVIGVLSLGTIALAGSLRRD